MAAIKPGATSRPPDAKEVGRVRGHAPVRPKAHSGQPVSRFGIAEIVDGKYRIKPAAGHGAYRGTPPPTCTPMKLCVERAFRAYGNTLRSTGVPALRHYGSSTSLARCPASGRRDPATWLLPRARPAGPMFLQVKEARSPSWSPAGEPSKQSASAWYMGSGWCRPRATSTSDGQAGGRGGNRYLYLRQLRDKEGSGVESRR